MQNQRITLKYRGQDGRQTTVVIRDESDDTAAEATAAFGAEQFTVDDLFNTLTSAATVTVITRYDKATFRAGAVLGGLEDEEPTEVVFEDYIPDDLASSV